MIERSSALHVWVSELTSSDVRRIFNSAVFLFDEIYINSNFTLDPKLSESERSFFHDRLLTLHEIGCLRTWNIEDIPQKKKTLSSENEYVISLDRYLEIYQAANEDFIGLREFFLGKSAINFDGITEIISGKQAVFHTHIAREIGAVTLLHDKSSFNNYDEFVGSLYGSAHVANSISSELIKKLNFPDVISLKKETIMVARRHLELFRNHLKLKIDSKIGLSIDSEILKRVESEVVPSIVEEYRRLRSEIVEEADYWSSGRWGIKTATDISREKSEGSKSPLSLLIELDK